jgi:hypothetical protein
MLVVLDQIESKGEKKKKIGGSGILELYTKI